MSLNIKFGVAEHIPRSDDVGPAVSGARDGPDRLWARDTSAGAVAVWGRGPPWGRCYWGPGQTSGSTRGCTTQALTY